MNIQQLEYIVALDKHRSFSLAAEASHITQATLSTMVRRLEEELDIQLFDRKVSPVITTDCGREIVDQAKKILSQVETLKSLPGELKGRVEGLLRIGVIPTIAGNLLHRVLPELLDKYPELRLSIKETTTKNIIRLIKSGDLDAGILSTPLEHAGLEEDVLYYEKLMVYGKTGRKNVKYLRPKDLAIENLWLLEKGNCLTDQVINVCSLNPIELNRNLAFQPRSFESLINIVDRMNGVTLIPELYYRDLPHEKQRMVSDFVSPYPVREISLVFYRPYAKQRLLDAVSKEIKRIICPQLTSSRLRNNEMMIAGM